MQRRMYTFLILAALIVGALTGPHYLSAPAAADEEKPPRHPAADHPHPEDFPANAENPEKESPYERPRNGDGDGDGPQRTAPLPEGSVASATTPELAGTVTAGTAFVPTILVDFLDNPAERLIHKPSDYQEMLFQKGYPYGAGSMRDYFFDQSGGILNVTGEVTPTWLTMPRTYSSYVGNSFGYQTTETNDFTLVKDAVALADPLMDFCKGDTNNDGFVDSLFVVHAGPGAEETGSGIWSVKWSLPTAVTTLDLCNGRAVKIKDFTIEPEEYENGSFSAPGAPSNLISIGVFAHEFGHVLGLPDLYDTDYSSPGGVGTWDVMASGTYGFNGRRPWRPTPLSAWSKVKMGWAIPQNVDNDIPAVTIRSVDEGHTGAFHGIFRLAAGGSPGAAEYFLVENRTPNGWAADIPSAGLAIWHVDTTRSNNSTDNRPLVTLVQADGLNQLNAVGNASAFGDGGDLFPGTKVVRGIDQSTTPDTDLYGGINSNVAVWRIGNPGATTVADLYVTSNAPRPPLSGSAPPGGGGSSPGDSTGPTPIVTPLPTLDDFQPRTDTTAPVISRISDSPDPFVVKASRRARSTIKFTLSENAKVTLSIVKSSGSLVVKLLRAQARPSGDSSVTWNGQDANSRRVRAGTYTYKIKAIDAAGNRSVKKGTIRVTN